MTNGEKLKEVFPSIELYEKSHDAIQINFNSVWWNAEYKESIDKIDCNHMECRNCTNHKYCDYESSSSEKPNLSGIPTGSDDCISRQDVLSEIIRFSTEEGASVECQQLYCDVNNMFPVTLIRPKGHWIKTELPSRDAHECSECGNLAIFDECRNEEKLTDFCPNCGAEMEEVDK